MADLPGILDLPPSTAHRALMTLEETGFAQRADNSARFVAGMMVHHLVRSMVLEFPARLPFANQFRPIAKEFDVAITLNWRVGWFCVRLFSAEGRQEAFQIRRLGEQRLLHDGVGPSTILASLPEQERKRYFARVETLRRSTDAEFQTEVIESYVRQIQADGRTRIISPIETGLDWVSLPLKGHSGDIVASASIGTGRQVHDEDTSIEAVEAVCDELSGFQKLLMERGADLASPFDLCDPDQIETSSTPWLYPLDLGRGPSSKTET